MLTLAHAGRPPAPHDAWAAWNTEPLLIAGLVVAWVLYRRGVGQDNVAQRRMTWFGLGLGTLAIALVSPIDAMGEALASAHMIQHLLIVMVAAPLMAVGRPGQTMLRSLSYRWRKRIGRARLRVGMTPARVSMLEHPVAIWLGFAAVLWLWHLPGPYGTALDFEWAHTAEHLTFLGAAFLFWRLTLVELGGQLGLAVMGVFTAAFQSTILAALLTFSRSPWYAHYVDTSAAWGLTPLDDQQLAGVIMWVPAGLIYVASALTLFARWIGTTENAHEVKPAP